MSASGYVFYSRERIPFSERTSQYVEIIDTKTGELDFIEGQECELYDDMIYHNQLFGNLDGMAKLRLALTPHLQSEDSGIARILRYESVERDNLDGLAKECQQFRMHEELGNNERVQVFLNQVLDLCDAANEMKNGIVVG